MSQRKRVLRSEQRRNSKKLRNSGHQYLSYNNKIVPEKSFNFVQSCCSNNCVKDINYESQKLLYNLFYDNSSKEIQDGMLSDCMTWSEAKTQKLSRVKTTMRGV